MSNEALKMPVSGYPEIPSQEIRGLQACEPENLGLFQRIPKASGSLFFSYAAW